MEFEPPARMQRVHVALRLVLLLAIGALGLSSLYWVIYLTLPALAAVAISAKGPERYLDEDAPGIARILRWFAAAYGYLWLLTDAVPTSADGGPIDLRIEAHGTPSVKSALLRLLYSIPALLLLMVLSLAAGLLWMVGVIAILIHEKVPALITDFLALVLRYQFRILAYHLSLVDRYPSLESAQATHAPHSKAA